MEPVTNRVNRQDRHLPILDCFRGIAILGVLSLHLLMGTFAALSGMSHLAHQFLLQALFFCIYKVFSLGGYGVAIFFVVSGFCIHLSHRRSADSGWLVFYARRGFRLYPAYLVSLFLCIVVFPSTRWPAAWPSPENQIDLLLHLVLAHNLLPQTFASINGPYWSLAIEFQLYLLFPLLLVMARRMGWRQTLMVTAMVEVISRLCLTIASQYEPNLKPADWWAWSYLSPFGCWFSWALGAALAEAFVEKQPLPFAQGPLPLWIWPLIVLVLHNSPLRNFTFPLAALGTARFMAYFLARDVDRPISAPGIFMKFLTFTGVISYSLYLLHAPLFVYFMTYRPKANGEISIQILELALIVGAFLALFAASYLLFRFVETPGIRVGKRVVNWLSLHRPASKPA